MTTETKSNSTLLTPIPPPKVLTHCDKCGVVMTFEEYLAHVRECE